MTTTARSTAKTGRASRGERSVAWGLASGLGLALLGLVGCTSSPRAAEAANTADPGRATERPSATVSRLEPLQMLLTRGTPTDSDANGFADTVPVVVYLFPDARDSNLPIWSTGTFRFDIRAEDGRNVGKWEFGGDLGERARVQLAPGPGYSFFLRLGPGQDRLPPINAELRASFVHEGGRVVETGGAATVRLGAARPTGESS